MLITQTHADLKFAANIQRLADSTEAIAKSLAVIAGLMANKEGRPFVDPTKHPTTTTPICEQKWPDDFFAKTESDISPFDAD